MSSREGTGEQEGPSRKKREELIVFLRVGAGELVVHYGQWVEELYGPSRGLAVDQKFS